jgi:shikimate dehydrogenase
MQKENIKKAAVIGFPVSQSLSPKLHGYWLETHGIYGSYEAIEIKPEHLKTSWQKLIDAGYAGWNVTIPHKEKAFELVDACDPISAKIGAVNTVVVGENKKTIGYNTDVIGFIKSIAPHVNSQHKTATIVGAGGAARAIVIALIESGIMEITIINRTPEKISAIINLIKPHYPEISWREKIFTENLKIAETDILVNTTSLGMTGQDPLKISISSLPKHAIVADIIYKPLQTELLKQAQEQNLVALNGLPMLIYQAMPGFRFWFCPEKSEKWQPEFSEKLKNRLLST